MDYPREPAVQEDPSLLTEDSRRPKDDVFISQYATGQKEALRAVLKQKSQNTRVLKEVKVQLLGNASTEKKDNVSQDTRSAHREFDSATTITAATAAAIAATAPLLKVQNDLETKVNSVSALLHKLQETDRQLQRVAEQQTNIKSQCETPHCHERVRELEKQMSAFMVQQIQHLEKLQEQQMNIQSHLISSAVSAGGLQQMPVSSSSLMTKQPEKPEQPLLANKVTLRQRGLFPTGGPVAQAYSSRFQSCGIHTQKSPLKTPVPRRYAPEPVSKNVKISKEENPATEKENIPKFTSEGEGRLLEHILNSQEVPPRQIESSKETALNSNKMSWHSERDRHTALCTESFPTVESSFQNCNSVEKTMKKTNDLLQDLAQLRREMHDVLQEANSWKSDMNDLVKPRNPTVASDLQIHHQLNKQSILENVKVPKSILRDAERILRRVQNSRKVLEENLEAVTRAKDGDAMYAFIDALATNRDVLEEIRIRKTVDERIKAISVEIQAEMARQDSEQVKYDQKVPWIKRAQNIKAIKTNKEMKAKSQKIEGCSTKKPFSAAKPLQKQAEDDRSKERISTYLSSENLQRKEKRADGPVNGSAVVQNEDYLCRVYGKPIYQGHRSTLKKAPYLRFNSPSPKSKLQRPKVIECVRGTKVKSARTQTCSCTEKVVTSPKKQHPLYALTQENQYFFSPSRDVPAVCGPLEGHLIPMAIPLGQTQISDISLQPARVVIGKPHPVTVTTSLPRVPEKPPVEVKKPNVAVIEMRSEKKDPPQLSVQVLPNVDIDSISSDSVSVNHVLPESEPALPPVSAVIQTPEDIPSEEEDMKFPGANFINVTDVMEAMASTNVFILFLQSIIQFPQMVGDELDEATRERMEQRAAYLNQEMARLLQELEQRSSKHVSLKLHTKEQSGFSCGALLFAALQPWQFWAIVGVLVVLTGLCWWFHKRSREADNNSEEETSSRVGGQEEETSSRVGGQEEETFSRVGGQEEEDEPEQELELEEEEEQEKEDSDGGDPDDERDLGRITAKRIQWPVQNLAYRSRVVVQLVGDFFQLFQELFPNSFFPVPQPAIGVGSTFEGWSPHEDNAVYRMLVPLKAPRGHAFHVELGTTGERPAKDCRIRVEQECTCKNEQLKENMLCFLHHSEQELKGKQGPSLVHTLCTNGYLDVKKTVRCFQEFMELSWSIMLQSSRYHMKVLPSNRSCKLQLTNASRRTLFVEVLFGVQQGDSDIFLSSQGTEAVTTPNTTWPESYAVAEVKFFRHVARQAPRDSFHLRCLQLCTHILVGTGFSTYTLKTAVMHLLTIVPLSEWCRKNFLLRLKDLMRYLCCCLEGNRLDHFFFGNKKLPEEILLPPAFRTAEPFNLFQHLAQDPAAHDKALCAFDELQNRLTRLLSDGHWKRSSWTEDQEEESDETPEFCEPLLELNGQFKVASPKYNGPLFPPVASAPQQSSDVLDKLIQGRETVENMLINWVEQEIMAKIISGMYPVQKEAVPSCSTSESEDSETVTSDVVEVAGGRGLQLFINAGVPVDSEMISCFVNEAVGEIIATMLGNRKAEKAVPATNVLPSTITMESLVPTPLPTPQATPPQTPPSEKELPPVKTPESPLSLTEMSGDVCEHEKIKETGTEIPAAAGRVGTPVVTPVNTPPRTTTPSPPASERVSEAANTESPKPPNPWDDAEVPLEEEKPSPLTEELFHPKPVEMSVANDEEPEALISPPRQSSARPFESRPCDPQVPSPVPTISSGQSTQDSSLTLTETETADRPISEGEVLFSYGQMQAARALAGRGLSLPNVAESLTSTLRDANEMDYDPPSEGQVVRRLDKGCHRDPVLTLLAKLNQAPVAAQEGMYHLEDSDDSVGELSEGQRPRLTRVAERILMGHSVYVDHPTAQTPENRPHQGFRSPSPGQLAQIGGEILGGADTSRGPMHMAELESQLVSDPVLQAAQPSCRVTSLSEDLSQEENQGAVQVGTVRPRVIHVRRKSEEMQQEDIHGDVDRTHIGTNTYLTSVLTGEDAAPHLNPHVSAAKVSVKLPCVDADNQTESMSSIHGDSDSSGTDTF